MKSLRTRGSAALTVSACLLVGGAALAAPAATPAPALPALAAALAADKKPAPAWLRPAAKPAAPALGTKQGPSPLRMGGMLALVATLGGVAYYARRRKQVAPAAAAKEQPRVLGSTRIGPKATAVVVEIAGKRILLGVTEHSVNNLAWLDDERNHALEDEASALHAAPAARPSAAPENATPSGFLKLLRSAVGSGTTQKVVASDEVARSTRDEVRISRRGPARREPRAAQELDDELVEGQVTGLVKRRKEQP